MRVEGHESACNHQKGENNIHLYIGGEAIII